MPISNFLYSVLLHVLLFTQSLAQTYTGPQDPRVKTELVLEHPANGVSTTPDGRIFLVISRVDGSTGPAIVEYDRSTNTSTAYPNEEWNSYAEGKDPGTHFVGINGQRIGPDGKMYVVDKGGADFGAAIELPHGPKIVRVDLQSNEVDRIYYLGNATKSFSFVDDIRFNPTSGFAYLTDAGTPGLMIMNLETGVVVRALDNHPSTKGVMPVSAEGSFLYFNDEPFHIYADHLEVSPDGKQFYFQPCQGGMSRIATQQLDRAFYNSSLNTNSVLGSFVEPFALTPSTGGTAIDANGNIFVSDTNSQRIVKVAPNGTMSTLVQDPRLLWVDAMWIDGDQKLWMPAAQLNRGTPFNDGESFIEKPLYVYSIDIGAGPSAIDHN